MTELIPNMTAVVLAGGKSRRMGRDKRFLEVEGQPLLERVCALVGPLFPELLVSVGEPSPRLEKMQCRVVIDEIPDCATLGGLYTSLWSSIYPRAFVVACDMPFVTEASIRRVVELSGEFDLVMAELATGLQPMHAVYSKACLPFIRRLIEGKHLKIQSLARIPGLNIRILQESELASLKDPLLPFFNINTPADLELARKLIDGMPPRN